MYQIIIGSVAIILIYLVMDSTGNKLYSLGSVNPNNFVTYFFGKNKVVISGVILLAAYFIIRYIRSDQDPYDGRAYDGRAHDEHAYDRQFRY